MPSSRLNKPVIAVTMGDPSGIGPEITLKALASPRLSRCATYLLIGDSFYLLKIAKLIGKKLGKLHINLMDIGNVGKCQFGKSSASSGRAALDYIDFAIELVKEGLADGIVTAPVNKESITKTGVPFHGHTEYLATAFEITAPAMMFVGKALKVVIVTRHIPLKKVAALLSTKKIIDTTLKAHKFLKKYFRIKTPRLAVAALNPHAGEGGLVGDEERKIIIPAVKKLQIRLPSLKGPVPADSAFGDLYNKKYDCLVCMYHDQGMIPVKMLAPNYAVNVTLGLPFVRTSPVHGTAFDIAGRGIADPSSMLSSLNLAARLIRQC